MTELWMAALLAGAAAGGAAVFLGMRRKLQRTQRLLDISMQLNVSLDRREQIRLIMEQAGKLLPVEAASVLLVDPATNELFFEIALGGEGGQMDQIRLRHGEGLAGHVAQTGQSVIVNDAASDPRWSHLLDDRTGFKTRNLMTIPIKRDGEICGVLQVLNKKYNRPFTNRDMELLELVAKPIAIALKNTELYEQLEQSMEQLQQTMAAKERLESELQIAGGIQMSFLPRTMPSANEPFDVCALLKSAKEVGGDFYNFFKLDNRRLFFTLGDVSDKGIPAALFMVVTLTLLKGHLSPDMSPGQLLERVNRELAEDDTTLFATIICGILDIETGELVLSDGGHCTPYIVKANGETIPYKLRKSLPLAAMPDVSYFDSVLQMQPGDRLVLYTDGITEAENAQQEQYGSERLEQFLRMTPEMSSAEVIDALLMNVFQFADGAAQSDDIAVLSLMRR